MWFQREITLKPHRRGFHLITDEVIAKLPQLRDIKVGLLHVFIQHTSASLAINENADPTVRGDMERHFNVLVPEGAPYFEHTFEGADDMPAHIKSTLIGSSQSIPITNGRLNLGLWQGLYLCEHRDHAAARTIIATLQGE
ncbi:MULTISPECIES: secondary thiamine-phosphate synthase enzyme YjbQ [Shewanella]|uniref:Secondary thiamine-phosphate synthase enzyme YjbQ n=1 Tax=Shewanella vesiculosa TaxID=518738 RepID=A0ABV0FRL1_9GAMM|nr:MULTISPECIES: secondary thiamine-phosphate synthase enzyme YjbQ [Shewanella]NCQ47137.1 YjbQ family protein [Shewanella frigidimarina]NCO73587.1 YjbQ family protein [Shewanella vesiculosa]NCP38626.1 YjbQ family protein [Shewanella vesiculosa]NCP71341.1 YjbQ family protein [Shewanella vesiculosa]NCP76278.1 YjbQ family protein [Shewanella vesiculosa]|tara:strand:+ start:206 stop:625 length:420 start_codon:yes stop_codon:yes gene_type:complete